MVITMLTLTSQNGNTLKVETSEIREMTISELANNGLSLSDNTVDLLTQYFEYSFDNADYDKLVADFSENIGYNDYFFVYTSDAKRYFVTNIDDFVAIAESESFLSAYDFSFDLANIFDSVNVILTILSQITFNECLESVIDQLNELDYYANEESE